ncbi:MAG: peptidase M14 [Saprospiraceae bacterium]|nr:peptidase M14 [Saprospiraceae bacterium]
MKWNQLYICILVILTSVACGQELITFPDTQYEAYSEPVIKGRRFKHRDIIPLIDKLPTDLFEKKVLGQSIEGRDIYQVKVGKGPTKILLWSQMHGNEPTATMAIFDLFNFFATQDSLDPLRNYILQNTTLYFIPMLNPDGAERYQRRNALQVDLNRDALRLQCPESKILKAAVDDLAPHWGFNLHDQNRYSSAGKTHHPASMSFLAPAYDEAKSWNQTRTESMQLIVAMNAILQNYLPNKIGRYSDEFEPRAFGDNIQKWGTRTILIETGALRGDLEKQHLRKLNFIALLGAFQNIINHKFRKHSLEAYLRIPLNKGFLHDVIIREATMMKNGVPYILDIGFRHGEVNTKDHRGFQPHYSISDIGDLHNYFAYQELDASGLIIKPGKVYPKTFQHLSQLSDAQMTHLLKDGYTTVRVQEMVTRIAKLKCPLNIIGASSSPATNIDLGTDPPLILTKDDEAKYAVINGRIFDLAKEHLLEK